MTFSSSLVCKKLQKTPATCCVSVIASISSYLIEPHSARMLMNSAPSILSLSAPSDWAVTKAPLMSSCERLECTSGTIAPETLGSGLTITSLATVRSTCRLGVAWEAISGSQGKVIRGAIRGK